MQMLAGSVTAVEIVIYWRVIEWLAPSLEHASAMLSLYLHISSHAHRGAK